MASVINTNSLSLMTQNNLNTSQSALNTAIQRLSSGLRINSAKDDAAGLAIANRFTSNINGLTQAQRNANDGISLAQTTEGALTEVTNNLQRIRQLSVQASTGTNSASDLQSIQDEIYQRLQEIDRTSAQTDFNGVKVLSADKTLQIQVGANDGQTIGIDLQKIDSKSLGLGGFNVGATTGPITQFKTTDANGATVIANVDLTGTDMTGLASSKGATLVGYGAYTAATDSYANYAIKDSSGNLYKIDATKVDTTTGKVTDAASLLTPTAAAAAQAAYNADAAAGSASTANPLSTLDAALSKVDKLRSALGAVQNRFDSAISNLGTTVTNLSTSRSRIQDADYATEVSNMTRANILQQAGTSVLAQANQSTQGVLSLLR